MIPYGRQEILQSDIDEVVKVLRSDLITQGPMVPQFEENLRIKVGAVHAVAVNSATSALHLACLALELKPGDLLWTSPMTFVASANCARYCGADVDFVDIDPRTLNISVDSLENKLELAARIGKLPKILVVVHFAGNSCDMQSISKLGGKYNVRIIEDASHALGGKYRNHYIGCCEFSDVTVFSFHPVKIITTGEGGMATTNNSDLAEKMKILRSHGITKDPRLMKCRATEPWYYEQVDLGYNYRMTDLEAALGMSQFSRLDKIVAARNAIANFYNEEFKSLPISTLDLTDNSYSAYHLYVIQLSDDLMPFRSLFFKELRKAGIGTQVHYIPVHLQPYYRSLGFAPGDYPNAEKYYAKGVSIPLFPSMGERRQKDVVNSVVSTLSTLGKDRD